MPITENIISELETQGAEFIHFIDISDLPQKMNKHFPVAILFGISLSPAFLKKVSETPDYVKTMIRNKKMDQDEFHLKEIKTDGMADSLAKLIQENGYNAYSQSERNIENTGFYNKKENRTPLPHKTLALMAGMGWIGKHNLLVTPEYGSALSMCSVLTDAPLNSTIKKSVKPKCGECRICIDKCPVKALKGKTWNYSILRDEIVDVYSCITCIECLVFCPFTQNYINKKLIGTTA